jgi:PAS domain S-box-containing protein
MAVTAACTAGVWLYIRIIIGAALPLYPSLALLIASLLLVIAPGGRRAPGGRARLWLPAVVAILGVSAWASWNARSSPDRFEGSWNAQESRSIGSTLIAAGEKVHALETLSTDIGEKASTFVLREQHGEGQDSLAFRLKTFAEFERLANEAGKSRVLPAGMEIGLQLFGGRGERIAWAGWPQMLSPIDEMFLKSGKHVVYSRQVSLYRVLTDCVPVKRENGEHAATIVVEIPLEANYKVNNKFIKGTSLADDINPGLAAAVVFDYYPASESAALGKRPGRPAAVPEAAESLGAGERFPSYMQPLSNIGGDKSTGLSRRAVVRNSLGNPLLDVSVRGFPFRHFLERRQAPFSLAAKLCVLAAFLFLFIAAFVGLPVRTGSGTTAAKAVMFVVFIIIFRASLLSFQTVTPASRLKIFDPVIFATPAVWGLMRSAGDLLITALAFIIALYGVLKIMRGAAGEGRGEGPGARSWMFLPKGALISLVLLAFFELSDRFVSTVVINANLRLIGQTVNFFQSQVIVLHLGIFLMMVGISLSAIALIWGVLRLRGRGDVGRACVVAAVLAVAASVFVWGWVFGAMSLLLLMFVFFAPRFIQREDLVSIVIAAFYLVVIISGVSYMYLSSEYQALRKTFVQEKAAELSNPADNWRAFIIEDVLDDLAKDPMLLTALRQFGRKDIQNLGFDLWAESPLSLLGYSSALYVFDKSDSVVSRFAVDMPFRADFSASGERTDTPSGQSRAVLNMTKNTARGEVRFYRGIVLIEEFIPEPGDQVRQYTLGKVVIDVPYFFENLSWAALTGPRTPEILRNVQEGGVEPRIEEPEALVLARLKGSLVLESSSDELPVGISLPAEKIQRAKGLRWPLLSLPGGACRFMISDTDEPGITLLAGFKTPGLLRHGLRWSTLLSLHMLFSLCIIVLIVMLKQIPLFKRVMPTLTQVRRLEFQQKLLASFFATALIPAIILGLFSVHMIKNRFVEENRDEALSKAFSAKKTLFNMLNEELKIISSNIDPDTLAVGEDEVRFAAGESGLLVVSSTGGDAALHPQDELFLRRDDGDAYIGVFGKPFVVERSGYPAEKYFYYGRKLTSDLLGEVADQVGADINIYYRGQLVASSREGLLASGLVNALMNVNAFEKVSLLGVDHALTTEQAGRYDYQVAYLRLRVTDTAEDAALSLPLLFQAESYLVEVRRASAVVFGIFALLFAATIGLGLVLARGIFEPLKYLLEGTKRIARGELTYKLPLKRRDEIGIVIEAFNEMTEKLAGSQTALEERKRYLEAILANVGTGVISTDSDDRIATVNDAAERILGVAARGVIGSLPERLVADGVAPEFFSALQESSRSREPFLSSELSITMDGRRRTIKYMHTKLALDERYLGTVFVFEDLTELIDSKKLSAWLEMSRQIAHEIKNPLTPIKLSTQFMQKAYDERSPDFEKIFKESSDTIIHQVDVLKRIAGEFSSFGRMQQLDMKPHPLAPLVEAIIMPYQQNASGVAVSLDLSSREMVVMADAEAFRKICTNLIENALEAMPDGGSLSIAGDEVRQDGVRFLRLSFLDSGPGLSEAASEKLFEPYFSTKTTGTGLGLAICRSLSREMGGDVTVENRTGHTGADATLLLPLA